MDKLIRNIIKQHVDEMARMYDDDISMVGVYFENYHGGYHTRRTGLLHETNRSIEYASALLYLNEPSTYGRIENIFMRLCDIQDTDPNSKTSGLWSYYYEEPLSQMRAPDYNWSDFMGKHFIYALSKHPEAFSEQAKARMRKALYMAMQCSIKRNVSPDYSNISMMSCMTIISAGELLGDEDMLSHGKARLDKAYRYNMFCGSFSEYNSSTYTPLAICELTRMLMYFKDEECRSKASALHDLAWQTLATTYMPCFGDLIPPEKRAYRDVDNGFVKGFIYLATGGKVGDAKCLRMVDTSMLMLPIKCPTQYMEQFENEHLDIAKVYYKKNNIRTPDEDTVIVRSLDSEDLTAYSYCDGKIAMGAFHKSDLWNQRRTSCVIWGYGDKETCFRLRCIKGDYDYCGGMVYTNQKGAFAISTLGLVHDHGDHHYILDKVKDGVITTDKLVFRFALSGYTDTATIERSGTSFVVKDRDIIIHIDILKWFAAGKAGKINFNENDKYFDLVVFEGEEQTVDTKTLGDTYGAFVMYVGDQTYSPKIKETEDMIEVTAQALSVASTKHIGKY